MLNLRKKFNQIYLSEKSIKSIPHEIPTLKLLVPSPEPNEKYEVHIKKKVFHSPDSAFKLVASSNSPSLSRSHSNENSSNYLPIYLYPI